MNPVCQGKGYRSILITSGAKGVPGNGFIRRIADDAPFPFKDLGEVAWALLLDLDHRYGAVHLAARDFFSLTNAEHILW